jgi:hypothetical protein
MYEAQQALAMKKGIAPSFPFMSDSGTLNIWVEVHFIGRITYRLSTENDEDLDRRLMNLTLELRRKIDTYQAELDRILSGSNNADVFLHEKDLKGFYGVLEALQTFTRIFVSLREGNRTKNHDLFQRLGDKLLGECWENATTLHSVIRKVAEARIEYYKQHGADLVAQLIRAGRTGHELGKIIPVADINFYAKEYQLSAIEAYKGILQVKLD